MLDTVSGSVMPDVIPDADNASSVTASAAGGSAWRPLVTVMIDNYNYAQYLPVAIDSALAQTYSPLEVLVVDDGSTDQSQELIAGYGDRVRSLLLPNGGQAAAVNAGLQYVRGELIILLDSDDLLAPYTVMQVVEQFRADSQCVRVQFRLRVIDSVGRATGRLMPPLRVPLLSGDLRPLLAKHRGWRWPTTSGNAWRTSALRAIPPIPAVSFRQAVDRWWADLVSLQGTVRALPSPGGAYRVHRDNFSSRQSKGLDYFVARIARRQELHQASALVARNSGLTYPARLNDLLDGALSAWQLAARKLGAKQESLTGMQRLQRELRGVRASLTQPNTGWMARLTHTGWYLALLVVPMSSRSAARLVALRYDRE